MNKIFYKKVRKNKGNYTIHHLQSKGKKGTDENEIYFSFVY